MSKTIPLFATLLASTLLHSSLALADDDYQGQEHEITITNISSTVMTPPIIALCRNKHVEPIAVVGEEASEELEHLAEGGDTSMLQEYFEDNGCNIAISETPILPGKSVTLEIEGRKKDFLHVASMLLPTNDGFIFKSGIRLKKIEKRSHINLESYDAGTEFNDEVCANIPGPQCGGEGFNEAREPNNFVRPHPGLHGKGSVAPDVYNWGDPVATLSVNND